MSDRYQITNLIGKDQLGSVYLAQDTTLQRSVVYRDFEEAKSGHQRPEGFSQYTGKLCALQHPNLLTIYDIAQKDDGYFMVTQFLEGESLVDRLAKGALNYVGVHNMACDLLDALHAAHSSGLYHGALRTDSVLRIPRVRGGHRYLIVDFGLDRISAMICGTHVIMADPVLMAPELFGYRQEPDARSDLFTLGQLCYISLVGGHPYAGKSPEECAQAYRDGGLPHLSTYVQGVQPEFANWVMWLVSGDPERRPASSDEAMKVLHGFKLEAAAPNVPGVTQAVEVPEAPVSGQPKITDAISVAQEPERKEKKPKAKKKKKAKKETPKQAARAGFVDPPKDRRMMMGAIGLVVLLLLVLVLLLVLREEEGDAVSPQSSEDMVELQELGLTARLLAQRSPVSIALGGKNTLDWTVVTGVPASSARSLMKGGQHIRNIVALGEFSERVSDNSTVVYQVGEQQIMPQRGVTGSKYGKAKEGDGWQIDVRLGEQDTGPLLLTLFMVQNQCDFLLEVRSTHTSRKGEVVRITVPKQSPGVARIPLLIADPQPGYYSVRVLAKNPSDATDFEMGLSAVMLERMK